ncbi:NAD-dependent epimerase/dehydratase family protein [Limimaricola sp.]|uniref:NAD-dependent epimerase/dehydratase family protein n=1 Tax=Limimaricola sp. TaxID=2211665 RepID=UPI0040581C1A
MKKIVLTGACGALGTVLRAPLAKLALELVSTDIAEGPADLLPNESFVQADLADLASVEALMQGAEMVVHFGAIPDERPFEELLGPNFIGAYTVWEAAHRAGARRVVYASSVHAVGLQETMAGHDTDVAHRPDSFYGLSKCFAEDMGKMFWDKRGLEAVCLRIMSCTPEPQNARALHTWLSHGDLVRLVEASVTTPVTGFTVAWGVSANSRASVSNHKIPFLGYHPQDNAEGWADRLLPTPKTPDPSDPAQRSLGGPFAVVPLGESGVEAIRRMSESD